MLCDFHEESKPMCSEHPIMNNKKHVDSVAICSWVRNMHIRFIVYCSIFPPFSETNCTDNIMLLSNCFPNHHFIISLHLRGEESSYSCNQSFFVLRHRLLSLASSLSFCSFFFDFIVPRPVQQINHIELL